MRTEIFDFDLPPDRIALRPAEPRSRARLLAMRPTATGAFALSDLSVADLPQLLRPGDALVVNNTRVIAARLEGYRLRGDHQARLEATLLKRESGHIWRALAKPAKKLQPGDRLSFGADGSAPCQAGALTGAIIGRDNGEITIAFDLTGPALDEAIAHVGQMPLPPYIAARRAPDAADSQDYQTIFAQEAGAVAAPTAGLHMTPDLMAEIRASGVDAHAVTLHVGAGTFLPVKADDTDDHLMHAEWGRVSLETARALNATRAKGGRIVALGTTALRILESAADAHGIIHPFAGETDIFITPGYKFRAVEALMTNFHLPRSTLFMLVCAFCGPDAMQAAYAHAITEHYRFYSYGDACFLERAPEVDRMIEGCLGDKSCAVHSNRQN